jgi:hypothetical protein
MNLGKHFKVQVYDYDSRPAQRFVNGCQKDGVRIGTYQKTKKHSYDNLAERVDEIAQECNIPARYAMSALFRIAERNLDTLFLKLTMFPDQWTAQEVADSKRFFSVHGKELGTPSHPKNKIPEDHDLEFLVSTHNLGSAKTHIASNDTHFTENTQTIEGTYNVIIIPMIYFDAACNMFGWPPPPLN